MQNINQGVFWSLQILNELNEKILLSDRFMIDVRIKAHEFLIWDGFVKISLIFSAQNVFKIKNAFFWIHLETIQYFKMTPLQEEKYLKGTLVF